MRSTGSTQGREGGVLGVGRLPSWAMWEDAAKSMTFERRTEGCEELVSLDREHFRQKEEQSAADHGGHMLGRFEVRQ